MCSIDKAVNFQLMLYKLKLQSLVLCNRGNISTTNRVRLMELWGVRGVMTDDYDT